MLSGILFDFRYSWGSEEKVLRWWMVLQLNAAASKTETRMFLHLCMHISKCPVIPAYLPMRKLYNIPGLSDGGCMFLSWSTAWIGGVTLRGFTLFYKWDKEERYDHTEYHSWGRKPYNVLVFRMFSILLPGKCLKPSVLPGHFSFLTVLSLFLLWPLSHLNQTPLISS